VSNVVDPKTLIDPMVYGRMTGHLKLGDVSLCMCRVMVLAQYPGSFLAYIVGQDPSDSKSNQLHAVIGEIFGGITGRDPSVCKCNRLHVDILRFSFIKLEYILKFL
jgi:hypothetical protein